MKRWGLNCRFRNVTYDTRTEVGTCDMFSRADKYLILNNHRICELKVGTDDVFSRADKYLPCV
jgi:hypothetical protein